MIPLSKKTLSLKRNLEGVTRLSVFGLARKKSSQQSLSFTCNSFNEEKYVSLHSLEAIESLKMEKL